MLEFLRKLFAYDKWAIDRSLASLEKTVNSRACAMLSHVLLAEKIWLTRLKGEDSSSIAVFEELSLDDCTNLSNELQSAYLAYLDSLDEPVWIPLFLTKIHKVFSFRPRSETF